MEQRTLLSGSGPVLTASLDQTNISPNGTVTLAGDITNLDAQDNLVLRIDWGQGQGGVLNQFLLDFGYDFLGNFWDPATRHFSVNHTYLGNLAPGTSVTYDVSAYVLDFATAETSNTIAQSVTVAMPYNSIASRSVFYAKSTFDTGGGAGHDAALAPDKVALLPGATASFANYTSYDRGINGLMVDIAGPVSGISAADFVFKSGNDNAPEGWTTVSATPTIDVRPGAGVGGANRVEITFADGTISTSWLQGTVLADANTGLAANDVFYFGNAAGETGNSPTNARVNAFDEITARMAATDSAALTNPCDFNRDGKVDLADQVIARSNPTSFLNDLKLITVPLAATPSAMVAVVPKGPAAPVPQSATTAAQASTAPPPIGGADNITGAAKTSGTVMAATGVMPMMAETSGASSVTSVSPKTKSVGPSVARARRLVHALYSGLRKLGVEYLRRV